MIRNNSSITEFETVRSSNSNSPNGFFLCDTELVPSSPSRFSPIPSQSSGLTNSPSKLVGTCKNCSFTFRVKSHRSAEFCSRDCETVATIFKQSSACSTPKTPKTAEEIRKSIYEFQNQLDAEEKKRKVVSNQNLPSLEEEYEEYRSRMKIEKKMRQSNSHQDFLNLAAPAAADTGTNTTTVWGLNPATLFFKTPKPLRPQLHAYF